MFDGNWYGNGIVVVEPFKLVASSLDAIAVPCVVCVLNVVVVLLLAVAPFFVSEFVFKSSISHMWKLLRWPGTFMLSRILRKWKGINIAKIKNRFYFVHVHDHNRENIIRISCLANPLEAWKTCRNQWSNSLWLNNANNEIEMNLCISTEDIYVSQKKNSNRKINESATTRGVLCKVSIHNTVDVQHSKYFIDWQSVPKCTNSITFSTMDTLRREAAAANCSLYPGLVYHSTFTWQSVISPTSGST